MRRRRSIADLFNKVTSKFMDPKAPCNQVTSNAATSLGSWGVDIIDRFHWQFEEYYYYDRTRTSH